MKKGILISLILMGVGIASVIVGAILNGVAPTITGDDAFNIVPLAQALSWIGAVLFLLPGIALVAFAVAHAVKDDRK